MSRNFISQHNTDYFPFFQLLTVNLFGCIVLLGGWAMLHKFVGLLYKFVGWLLIHRKGYISSCEKCGRENEQYFPYAGAFFWEREYWASFQPYECCGQAMIVERSFDGIYGAMYRLPGYKAHDNEHFRRLISRISTPWSVFQSSPSNTKVWTASLFLFSKNIVLTNQSQTPSVRQKCCRSGLLHLIYYNIL